MRRWDDCSTVASLHVGAEKTAVVRCTVHGTEWYLPPVRDRKKGKNRAWNVPDSLCVRSDTSDGTVAHGPASELVKTQTRNFKSTPHHVLSRDH